ncbi:anti-sigma factor [Adhaeribacter arboris]|uniref:Anti-sigma factor n=1 Tax=Adhaeribacter arboris TaxID=2072846 RepID=A0A2T2YJ58_9BACT|nr:HEAT repeat domain-containing protein [Adhaeribacter arboris]PSR55544.1 anti-sigma factor [Adhaeribacter arboris]
MMDEKYIDLVTGHLEGTLTLQQEAELQEYIEQGTIKATEITEFKNLYCQIGDIPAPEPSAFMKADFQSMLADYKKEHPQRAPKGGFFGSWLASLSVPQVFGQVVFGMLVLAIGIGIGFRITPAKTYEKELSHLTGEVQNMREVMMLTLLKQSSATERLKAVNLTGDLETADTKVIRALLQTLNNDPNVNVRLATIEALYQHASNPTVREGLIAAISQQDSPLVQIALADVMLSLQEKKSVAELQKLLRKKDLNQAVEAKVKQTINVLI